MPKIGLNLKQLTREELEEYAHSLEIFAGRSDNPVVRILLYDHMEIPLKKRCEVLKYTSITDHNKAIADFLWQKIECSRG